MNQRDDVAQVYGFIRSLMKGRECDGCRPHPCGCGVEQAFFAAERLHQSKLEGDTEPAGPIVFGLRDEDDVASVRKLAVSRGWFEVPSGSYEKLRMIDGATGGHVIVYFGKRGLKAVANVGQPAAQELLREWKKTARKAS